MLPEPPDCPREFSDTPRLNTCGKRCMSAVVETGAASSMSWRETWMTVEPTGSAPRMRLPVTMISSRLSLAAGGAGSWASTAGSSRKRPP